MDARCVFGRLEALLGYGIGPLPGPPLLPLGPSPTLMGSPRPPLSHPHCWNYGICDAGDIVVNWQRCCAVGAHRWGGLGTRGMCFTVRWPRDSDGEKKGDSHKRPLEKDLWKKWYRIGDLWVETKLKKRVAGVQANLFLSGWRSNNGLHGWWRVIGCHLVCGVHNFLSASLWFVFFLFLSGLLFMAEARGEASHWHGALPRTLSLDAHCSRARVRVYITVPAKCVFLRLPSLFLICTS